MHADGVKLVPPLLTAGAEASAARPQTLSAVINTAFIADRVINTLYRAAVNGRYRVVSGLAGNDPFADEQGR